MHKSSNRRRSTAARPSLILVGFNQLLVEINDKLKVNLPRQF